MRSFSNFLLFEDILSNLPADSTLITSVANTLISPTVKLVEEDCGTLLGDIVDLNFEKEGLIELATGVPLTRARITQILHLGQYKAAVRNLHTCTSIGGVCRKCYAASHLGQTAPGINSQQNLDSLLNFANDIIVGNSTSLDIDLTVSDEDYDQAIVIQNGAVVTSGYSISGMTITFVTAPSYSDVFVVKFYRQTSEPLQGYLSKSYSGDLLGMKPLPTLPTIIRESLYTPLLPDGILSLMEMELHQFKAIPSTYIDYISKIHDRLERALFIIYLYAIFSNVQV
jgi:hypothetical protein